MKRMIFIVLALFSAPSVYGALAQPENTVEKIEIDLQFNQR